MPSFSVSTFYRFVALPDPAGLREPLQTLCDTLALKGILLLAPEGVNGTLAGAPGDLAAAMAEIYSLIGGDLAVQTATCEVLPFLRMKVRLKKEIVTLGVKGVDPTVRTGTRVGPEGWNRLVQDPGIPLIDVRNRFEHALGTFEGAIDPTTTSFGDFPGFVQTRLDPKRVKAVAMFCTGGIRCEKASAYMLDQGFETVYQLSGGILAYLARVPPQESLWRGDCFVFDGRVGLGHGLTASRITVCYGCRRPLAPADRSASAYVEGICCSACAGFRTPGQRAGAHERHRQVGLATQRGVPHLGTAAQITSAMAEDQVSAAGSACGEASTKARAVRDGAHGGARSENT